MSDQHRVFLEPRFVLRCASCGSEFRPEDIAAAQTHVLNGGPKVVSDAAASAMYPCASPGCDRSFSSEHGLAVHTRRTHAG